MSTVAFLSQIRNLGVKLWVEGDLLKLSAPKGSLTAEIKAQLKSRKSEIVTFLKTAEQAASTDAADTIQVIVRDQPIPLSFAQERLWFVDQYQPGSSTYNMPVVLKLEGDVKVEILRRCFEALVERHEILRTTFSANTAGQWQIIHPMTSWALPVTDLSTEAAPQRVWQVLAKEEAATPFDLNQGPLFRTRLLHLDNQHYILLVTMHHIISDGWSMGVLVHEVSALYAAFSEDKLSPLLPLAIQYADFSAWQRQTLQGEVLQQHREFWRESLAGVEVLELLTDHPRPPAQTFKGATIEFSITASLIDPLQLLAKTQGATLFMVLLAAFKGVLFRYTQHHDICVGTPIANRTRAELEPLIGFFVNTLALRTELSGDLTFEALLNRVKQQTLVAYAHQDAPLEKLMDDLGVTRDLSRSPLFQVMFALQNAPMDQLTLPGMTLSPVSLDNQTAKFDLTLSLQEGLEQMVGFLEYNTDLFERSTMCHWVSHFKQFLHEIGQNPNRKIMEYPFISDQEKVHLLTALNQNQRHFDDQICLQQVIENIVEKYPDAIAVTDGQDQLSYRELNQKANQLADYLRQQGVGVETTVAVYMHRSIAMITALFATIKAGGVYVPVDPAYPPERVSFMIEDAGVQVLISQQNLYDDSGLKAPHVLCLDRFWPELDQYSGVDPELPVHSRNLAYIIYTSGSTGQPKGVQIEHRSLLNLIQWHQRQYQLTPVDRTTHLAGVAFDASVWEIWPTLCAGASLWLVTDNDLRADPHRLLDWFLKHEIGISFVPTPVAEVLMTLPWPEQAKLRALLTGGDLLHHFMSDGLPFKLYNHYGPTECTVLVTAGEVVVNTGGETVPSIGEPIDNTLIYILDATLQPVPQGIAGELCLGGVGVARGYLNRPELNLKTFIQNPFVADESARLYRTGDLARYRYDGALEFLGRIDHQVKIRGFRIELGEIESVLGRQPAVKECVVLAREDPPGSKQLVAYVVVESTALETQLLKAALAKDLPHYMIPAIFMAIPALPMTPNGKLDRKALPAPEMTTTADCIAPRNEAEAEMAAIWAQVLGRSEISVVDNFFDLGGHSLLATQVISRIKEQMAVDVPVRWLFENPTITRLTLALQTSGLQHRAAEPPLIAVSRAEPMVVSFAQERLWFLDQLEPGDPIYNIPIAVKLTGHYRIDVLEHALTAVLNRHEVLRTTFSSENGQARLVIHDQPQIQIKKSTIPLPDKATGSSDLTQIIHQLAFAEARQSFDLKQGPLFRTAVLMIDDHSAVMLLTLHHIVFDGWSAGILVNEVAAYYKAYLDGVPANLPELAIQYADFAYWQRQWLQGDVLQGQLDYWKKQLTGAPALINLPTDRPRPTMQTFNGAHFNFELTETLTTQLQQFSQHQGVTLFMLLLAGYQLLLSRYAGQQDVCVGIPIAGRNRKAIETLIGFFVNGLIMRTHLSGNPTVSALLKRVREVTLSGYAHQDLSFELLVEALQPERNLSYAPLAQVAFALQNAPMNILELPDLSIEPLMIDSGTSKYDFTLVMYEEDGKLHGSLEYNTDLYDAATMAQLTDHYQHLLNQMLEQPELPINQLQLVSHPEIFKLLGLTSELHQSVLPLTPMQRDLYLESVVNPDTLQNSLGLAVVVAHEFDEALWFEALQKLTDEVTLLRAGFKSCSVHYADVAYLAVKKEGEVALSIEDCSQPPLSEAALAKKMAALIYHPYDLQNPDSQNENATQQNLIQHHLIKLGAGKTAVIIAAHHAILDGVAVTEHFLAQFEYYQALCQQKTPPQTEDIFAEYIESSRQQFDSPEILDYWRTALLDSAPLDFPMRQYPLGELPAQPITRQLELDAELWVAVKKYARKNSITPAIFFKTLYGLLLNQYCRAEHDFVVNEYFAGRGKGHQHSLGCYYLQIPFIFRQKMLNGTHTIYDLFTFMRDQQKQSAKLQTVSIFAQRQCQQQGRLNFSFNFYHFSGNLDALGQQPNILQYSPPVAEGQVQLIAKVVADTLQLNLLFQHHVFQDFDLLKRMVDLAHQLIDGTLRLNELKYVTPAEQQQQVVSWNQTAQPLPEVVAVQTLFERQVALTPDAPAVIQGETVLSYAQLNTKANQLAHALRAEGVMPGSRVGICVQRSVDMVVAVWAVVKAGGAYVAMDASYPRERLAYMLNDADAKVFITQRGLRDQLPAHGCPTMVLDGGVLTDQPKTNPEPVTTADDLLYIIYTSGSTGRPKGAAVKQQGELNLLHWYCHEFEMTSTDRVLLISAFGFDLTQKNIFAPLVSGAALIIPESSEYDDQHFLKLIQQHQVSWLNCAPSAFYPLVAAADQSQALTSLRYVFLGGESINLTKLQPWLDQSSCQLINSYGPTECTDIAAYYRVQKADQEPLPIGKPNYNVQLLILNQACQLLPAGVTGELCIAGLGVGAGYLGDEEKTREKFIDHPFAEAEKLYRTGDLARYGDDGNIEYIGRVDFQVKLRGLRIELGEIEYALQQNPAISDAQVLVKNEQLVAYVISHNEISQDDFKQHLADYLPEYMVPVHYITLALWPLTANGKIDRKALPDPITTDLVVIPPGTITQSILCEQWQQLLAIDMVGINQRFFDLGGHSLLATQAVSKIREHFKVEVPLRQLFETPTVEQLAHWLDIELRKDNTNIASVIEKANREQPLPLSYAQQRLWFFGQMEPDNSLFNINSAIRLSGQVEIKAFQNALDQLVLRHEILRTTFEKNATLTRNDGESVQVIQATSTVALQVVSLITADNQDEVLKQQLQAISVQPFDLAQGPMLRVVVFQLDDAEWVLLLSIHHIISDGWSSAIFIKELVHYYQAAVQNRQAELAALPVQYADFSCWQRQWLQGAVLESQMAYWQTQLKDLPEALNLPLDHPRPPIQTFNGETLNFKLPAALSSHLTALCRDQNVTLFMVLLATYQLLLSRYSGQQDIAVGIPVAGRNRVEIEGLIGCFVNALVMRTQLTGNPTLSELFKRVKEMSLDAFAHQDLPFEMLVEQLQPERQLSRPPLAQVAFTLQNTPEGKIDLPGFSVETIEIENKTAKYDITWVLVEGDEGLNGAVEYNADLFEVATIERMIRHYQRLLEMICQDTEQAIEDIQLISDSEMIELLNQEVSEIETILPLTPMQRDLYLEALLDQDTLQNSLGFSLIVEYPLIVDHWQQALDNFTTECPLLRIRILGCQSAFAEMAYQCVFKTCSAHFEYLDQSQADLNRDQINRLTNDLVYQPYAETQFRNYLINLGADRFLVVLAVHHALLDGVGGTEYLKRLSAHYLAIENKQPLATQNTDNFAAYVHLSRQLFDQQANDDYWREAMAQVEPLDFPAPPGEGVLVSRQLMVAENHWQAIKKYCRQQRITPAHYFKAIYSLMLKHYCRTTADFYIHEFNAGRPKGHANSLGCYYQQIPMVYRHDALSGNSTIADLFAALKQFQKSLDGHQNVSILHQQQLLPQGRLQFFYNFYHFSSTLHFLDQEVRVNPFSPPTGKGYVQFIAKEVDGQMQLNLHFHDDVFNDLGFLQRMVSVSQQLVNGITDLAKLSYVNQAERQQQLIVWNQHAHRLPAVLSVQEMFEAQVTKTPDAIAVMCGQHQLTYQQLNQLANQLAHYLRGLGIAANKRVGVCVERSIEMMVAVLGVIKSGGAYIAMDAAYPQERLAYMLRDADAPVLVSQCQLQDIIPEYSGIRVILDKDTYLPTELTTQSRKFGYMPANTTQNPENDNQPNDLLYIIYTSGSTGRPKGAGVMHRGEINLLDWFIKEFEMRASDRSLIISAFGFDLTQKNLFAVLCCGGAVVLPEVSQYDVVVINQTIRDQQITLLNCAPSAFYPLVENSAHFQSLATLRQVFLGGEPIQLSILNDWLQSPHCQCQIVNTYGPTECTDIAAFHRLHDPLKMLSQEHKTIPLGQPNANVQLYILTEHQQLLPPGITGELCIAGQGVGVGYLNNETLTKEKFQPNPFGEGRLYRTGDLACYRHDGLVEYVGRIDFQVKLRGLRIELDEINFALQQMDTIEDSLVTVSDETLIAYVITEQKQLDQQAIKTELGHFLPDYMIPAIMMPLIQWPLTANGKLDRKALPEPIQAQAHYRPASNDIEQQLVAIWEQILGLQPIGVNDDFFTLGGHSLLAVRLMSAIESKLNSSLPLSALFQNATIEKLAYLLTSKTQDQLQPPLVAIHPQGEKTPIFCVHAIGGSTLAFLPLAKVLGDNQPLYGLEAMGLQPDQNPQVTIEAMVETYTKAIQEFYPMGPFILSGHSMGGIIAFEMAIALSNQGRHPEQLILLESPSPTFIAKMNQSEQMEWDAPWAGELENFFHNQTNVMTAFNIKVPDDLSLKDQLAYFLNALYEQQRAGGSQQQNSKILAVHVANFLALLHYQTESIFSGETLLCRAKQTTGHTEGWSASIKGRFALVDVEGGHNDMLETPHVESLGACLNQVVS